MYSFIVLYLHFNFTCFSLPITWNKKLKKSTQLLKSNLISAIVKLIYDNNTTQSAQECSLEVQDSNHIFYQHATCFQKQQDRECGYCTTIIECNEKLDLKFGAS